MRDHVVSEDKSYRLFLISVTLTIGLFLCGVFLGVVIQTRNLIYKEIHNRASVLFDSIVLARKWNAHYGGVYVEKKEGMESSPYLDDPDLTTIEGRVYTKKNPALMTREISQFAKKEGLFSFHITSLNPLNPDNYPDAFEREALLSFSDGREEAFQTVDIDNGTFYRYMAPLYVEASCLVCHADQGYALGDVRGGISITFDIREIQTRLKRNSWVIITLGIVSTFLLLLLIYLFTRKLMRRLSDARRKIEKMAITDELTGVYNRRHIITIFEIEFRRAKRLGRDLGCILIDIDHFKEINDTFGHLSGDKVLHDATGIVRGTIRAYDILGRYGGEEFLVVMPESALEDVQLLAERIRMSVRNNGVILSRIPGASAFTISLGISVIRQEDNSIDDILTRADRALYKAKADGRDRVRREENS